MLYALLVFLVGCLILACVIYVAHLIMNMLTLPPPVKEIALLIFGLIGLVLLLILTVQVFNGAAIRLF